MLRLVTWPIPDAIDLRAQARARLTIVFAAIFGVVAIAYAGFMASVGEVGITTLAAATAGLMFATPWAMKRSGSVHVGVHLVVFGGWLAVGSIAAITGGLEAPVVPWLALVPAGAVFLDGRKAGRIWLAICLASAIAFGGLDLSGILVPEPSSDTLVIRRAIALGVLISLLTLMMIFYDRSQEELRARLESSNQALEASRDAIARKNEELASAHRELATTHAQLIVEAEAQRRLELELRQAQKLEAVGRLAAGVAHELNTPLQFVSDSIYFVDESVGELIALLDRYRRVLERSPASDALREVTAQLLELEQQVDLPFILASAPKAITRSQEGLVRMASIVRAMKEFAYADATELVPLDLNQALMNTLAISKAEYRGVADVVTDLGQLPSIECRAGEVNQVILNLVVNAAHAIEERVRDAGGRGTIAVRTVATDDGVTLSVSDDGAGIPENVRHRVFDPFFTTKPVGKGSGQGLAISRSVVVDKHGGTLSFTTEQGRGTTFVMHLPLRPPPLEAHHRDSG